MEYGIEKSKKIYLAGHQGLVGSAILRRLESNGYSNVITTTRAQLDLINQQAVYDFLLSNKPEYIIVAAAKVGGIHANNTYPADFIFQNLMIECNLIHGAYQSGAKRLLFLGSSCIYPKHAEQPMVENALLNGFLEPTNEPYAVAKIAGIKLCESYNRQYGTEYRSVMPTNLYGPNDNFHLQNSHVIPALIHKLHIAKENKDNSVQVWGSGNAKREFLYVDDMAEASLYVLGLPQEIYTQETQPMLSHINVGTGEDISITELAVMVKEIVGFKGELVFDAAKPDGPPRKLLDVSRLQRLGWAPSVSLRKGLELSYHWFLKNSGKFRDS